MFEQDPEHGWTFVSIPFKSGRVLLPNLRFLWRLFWYDVSIPFKSGRVLLHPADPVRRPVHHRRDVSIPFKSGRVLLPGSPWRQPSRLGWFQSPSSRGGSCYVEKKEKVELAALFQSPSSRGGSCYERKTRPRAGDHGFQSPSSRGGSCYEGGEG